MPLRPGRAPILDANLPLPPAGWERDKGVYMPIGTIDGCQARRVVVVARCKALGCRRRVDLDFTELSAMGFGRVQTHDVQKMFECRRPGPCGLRWEPEQYPAGFPLASLVDLRRDAKPPLVGIDCEACRRSTRYAPIALADTLRRRGVGDLGTGVIELKERIRGPCRACGVRRWEVRIVRP